MLEDIYNFEDVLQVGCILNTFIRKSNVVKIACIAQLVNVIAPIMIDPMGKAWRQTIYYPYYFASIFGRGTALNLAVSSPGYTAEVDEKVPFLDVSGVHDAEAGVLSFFAVNRHPTEALDMAVSLQGFAGAAQVIDYQVMTHAYVNAVNTSANPMAVAPRKASGASIDGDTLTAKLPPLSCQMLRVKLS